MSYAPTTWVERVTRLGPTNLNKIELGVQATASVADAAVPKVYVSSTQRPFTITHTVDDALDVSTVPAFVFSTATVTKTNTANPSSSIHYGIYSEIDYGDSTHAAVGTVTGITSALAVTKSGNASSEHAPFMGWLRYDATATPGRGWFADFSLHGAIATQQSLLSGITMFANNYYNGSPSSAPAAAIWIVNQKGTGGGADAAHQAATTYPMDIGLGVGGTSGALNDQEGFTVGIKVGGFTNNASGWACSSRLGTGIIVDSWDTAGVHVQGRYSGATGPALKVTDAINLPALHILASTDTVPRFALDTTGKIEWGSGSVAADVNLYRTAANYLQNDGVTVGVKGVWGQGGVVTKTKAGTPTDADLDTALTLSGAMILDTTASKIWFRVGTTWKSAALT